MPDFGNRTVLVVRHDFDEDGDAAGAVPLVDHFLIGDAAIGIARSFFDGPVDVVLGHVLRLGRQHSLAKPGIGFRIPTAEPGRQGYFLDQFCEYFSTLRINGAFFPFDGAPFRMA